MEVNSNWAFITVARLCGIGWTALGSHDRLPYDYNTGKLSRVGGLEATICNTAESNEQKIDGTEGMLPI